MNLLAEVAEGARHRAELIVATSFPANLAIPPFRSTDCSASADLNGTPAGWYVCDVGRCRVKSSGEESGQSSRAVPVRLFVHALHDCFTRPKRERASQDLSHCHQTKFDSGSSSLCELPERRMPKGRVIDPGTRYSRRGRRSGRSPALPHPRPRQLNSIISGITCCMIPSTQWSSILGF